MHLLLANDDGIEAPGLAALIEALAPLGRITVVAPQSERSATAHAIKVFKPCLLTPRPDLAEGVEAYSLDANPADCVKCALSSLCAESPPDVVISGINRGQNTGNNVIYSGTVAAAIEAAMYDRPAMAISLAARRTEEADFSVCAGYARRLVLQIADRGLPRGVILNVNVPNLPREEIAGVLWTRQGHARFTDHFAALEEDNPPGMGSDGQRVLRNIGETMTVSEAEGDDDFAIAQGFISVSPLSFDLTHHPLLAEAPPVDLSL